MAKRWKPACGVLCGLLPVWGLLVWLARSHPDQVERWYSQGFYQGWAGLLLSLTSRVPFSLAEILVILAGLAVLVWLASLIRAAAREKGKRLAAAGRHLLAGGAALSLVAMLFLMGGGLNYYRYTFTQHSGLVLEPSSVEELADLCRELAADASALREGLPEDGAGVSLLTQSHGELARTAADNYRLLMEQAPGLEGLFDLSTRCRVKPVFFSEAMSYMEIVGVFFPFTLEANINVHTTDFDIPFAACHELAHISGFMREDEANFLAYAACRASEDGFFRYSGAATALIHATNALYSRDYGLYQEVMSGLSDGVRRDLAASSAYYNAHHTSFGEFSTQVNDTYLRVNNQSDGVDSYGRMVDLLLADYRQRHGLD